MHLPNIQAHINLAAILHNYQLAQKRAPNSEVMPVVKANAYGHGAIPIAKFLAEYCKRFAVARFSEALELRDAGINHPIVIMSESVSADAIALCAKKNFQPILHTAQDVNALTDASNLSNTIHAWLKVDTGMHRLGIDYDDAKTNIEKLTNNANISDVTLMSHFATADSSDAEFMQLQKSNFLALKPLAKKFSLANSAAILRDAQTHLDVLRPGIMLYGADPLFNCKFAQQDQPKGYTLQAAMRLTAPVLSVREIKTGESVGYNRSWYAGRDSRIATIGIGYADGYPRHAKSGTPVAINGEIAPLVGTVSMDMITVDITALENVSVNDRVELWGETVDANIVAQQADTIAYELFTHIGKRVEKIYIS